MESATYQQNQVTFDLTNVKEDHPSKVKGLGHLLSGQASSVRGRVRES